MSEKKRGKGSEKNVASPSQLSREFEAIITSFFPTTRYLDSRFELLELQINELRRGQDTIKEEMNRRFEEMQRRFVQIDRRFEQVDEGIKDFKEQVDRRFGQVDEGIREFKEQVDRRFEQVDKRFEQVDGVIKEFKEVVNKRFEQVDRRFAQVEGKFDQIIASIDRLTDRLEVRDREQRDFTLRMFSISIAISVLGVLGAMLKIMGVF